MHRDIDEKKMPAIELRDARVILGDLVNVLSVDDTPDTLNVLSSQNPVCYQLAEQFISKHGALRDKQFPSEVLEYARRFRLAWWAKNDPAKIPEVNSMLDDIFSSDPFSHPIVGADFAAGKWEPRPKTLLGLLAVTLLRSRRMLHRCERPECRRYFVKPHSRAMYCSDWCSKEMRTRGQTEWAVNHRDHLNARRRKPHRKPGRRKVR